MIINRLLVVTILLITQFIGYSCKTVPVSGRRQVAFLPESMLVDMSLTSYNDFLASHRLSSDAKQTAMIKNVGNRISSAVEDYLRDNGLDSRIKDFQWEFNLIEEDVANAWAIPGGKIVFYSGILPITKTVAGVAVVMGYEIFSCSLIYDSIAR
jgi:predicted Zn-dependent protease